MTVKIFAVHGNILKAMSLLKTAENHINRKYSLCINMQDVYSERSSIIN